MLDKQPQEDIGCIQLEFDEVMVSILASWKGPDQGAQVFVFGSLGYLRASGSTGVVEIHLVNEVMSEQVCIPWSEQDQSARKMVTEFIDRCLKGQKMNEKDLELWDTGTRSVLEAYQHAEKLNQHLLSEKVHG